MVLSLEMDASRLKAKIDSHLVDNQFVEEYLAKEPQLINYLLKVQDL